MRQLVAQRTETGLMPLHRPLSHANLDAKRKDLARAVCAGQPVRDAGKALGFTKDEIDATVDHPAFSMAIRVEIMRQLNNVTAPQAIKILSELMTDKNVLPSVRRQAASDLLDRAGFVAPKATERDIRADSAPLSDMSTDALQTLVNRLESELAARATPVSGRANAPNGPISGHKKDNPL